MTHSDPQNSHAFSLLLALTGGALGVLLSYGVLNGNAQGQVNLLFLLLLFVFVPVAALILSLVFLVRREGRGLVGWLLDLPLWTEGLRSSLVQASVSGSQKAWLIYHAQLLSLGFSLGCLSLYLLLLLATDMTFVWRSTLLQAEHLLPLLDAIAAPWWFWSDAQATLPLLEQTRDYRLDSDAGGAALVGLWWRYILAAQLTYSLLPRGLLLVLARLYYRRVRSDEGLATSPLPGGAATRAPNKLAGLVESVSAPYLVMNWARAPAHCLQRLEVQQGRPDAILDVNATSAIADAPALATVGAVVVIVKSWEPPLAELADLLAYLPKSKRRILLPMDWNEQAIVPVREVHLDEWRRFAAELGSWQVLQIKEET